MTRHLASLDKGCAEYSRIIRKRSSSR